MTLFWCDYATLHGCSHLRLYLGYYPVKMEHIPRSLTYLAAI